MNARELAKLQVFTRFAKDLGSLSTCKRASVGCVIVPHDYSRVLAIGYNGPARGFDNGSCTGEEGTCGCVHAETNAVIKLMSRVPCWMITTSSPCVVCARAIVNVGNITKVLYLDHYRSLEGIGILAQAKIDSHCI